MTQPEKLLMEQQGLTQLRKPGINATGWYTVCPFSHFHWTWVQFLLMKTSALLPPPLLQLPSCSEGHLSCFPPKRPFSLLKKNTCKGRKVDYCGLLFLFCWPWEGSASMGRPRDTSKMVPKKLKDKAIWSWPWCSLHIVRWRERSHFFKSPSEYFPIQNILEVRGPDTQRSAACSNSDDGVSHTIGPHLHTHTYIPFRFEQHAFLGLNPVSGHICK